jgi:hypothetical protein
VPKRPCVCTAARGRRAQKWTFLSDVYEFRGGSPTPEIIAVCRQGGASRRPAILVPNLNVTETKLQQRHRPPGLVQKRSKISRLVVTGTCCCARGSNPLRSNLLYLVGMTPEMCVGLLGEWFQGFC